MNDKQVVKDVVLQVTGFLSALLMFFAAVGIKLEWFNENSINAFGFVLTAAISLAITLYTIFKNHYGFTKKAREDKQILERSNRYRR